LRYGRLGHFAVSSGFEKYPQHWNKCCGLTNSPGILLAYADTSLVWATHETVASRFDNLENSSWVMTSFTIGYCVTLPLVCIVLEGIVILRVWEDLLTPLTILNSTDD
jgi:hypothetical protein